MRRLLWTLFLLPSAGLLSGGAPVPLSLSPPAATLGVPLQATLDLPDDETQLAGLPPLGSFELLAPPRKEGKQLHLVLLPMRPGRHTLPAIPLHQGRSRQISTAPMAIEVAEGVPADARPAPLKGLSSTGRMPVAWLVTLFLAPILFLAFALRPKTAKSERRRPVPLLAELSGEVLLTELQRQLEASGRKDDERWKPLARRLERLRFAPAERPEEAIRQLLADFLKMAEETP